MNELINKANQIRNMVLDISEKAQTGHVTSSFSCTEILVALYYGGILKFDPKNPNDNNRDRFVLSKGQASLILYPILADLGFFPREDLETFCAPDGKFGVHLQHNIPGVEITSGSLGIGFGIATGMAAATNKLVVSLLGDGECYEGSIWEAAMFAAHHKLNNLVAIIDRNQLCATDFTEKILALEPLDDKWKSFGWEVLRIDGHSFEQLLESLKDIRNRESDKPLMIIADTIKGKGVSFIIDKPLRHGTALVGEEANKARKELNQEK